MIAVVLLIVGPLVPTLLAGLRSTPLYESAGTITLAHYRTLVDDPAFWRAAMNSVYLALAVAIPSVALGTALAVLVTRTNLVARRSIGTLLMLPLLLPGLGLVLGWISMYAPTGFVTLAFRDWFGFAPWNLYSLPGMALVLSCKTVPLAYLFAQGSLAGMDPSLENAARTAGSSPIRAVARITIPMMRPAVLSGFVIVLALSIEELGVPLLLGTSENIDTVSTYLYRGWTSGRTAIGVISAGGTLLLGVTAVLILLRNSAVGSVERFTTLTGKPKAQQSLDLGRWRWPCSAIAMLYIVMAVGIPLVGLILTAFTEVLTPLVPPWDVLTLGNFERVFASPTLTRSIRNSLIIASVGAVLTVAIATLAAFVGHRSDLRFRWTLPPLLLFPRAVPGLVLGLGFFWMFISISGLSALRTTIWVIVVAFAVRQIPLAYGAIYPALTAISSELDAAARTTGADWWTTCRRILIPILRPALIGGGLLAFVAMLNDYDPAVFLVTPGTEVIGLTMLQQWLTGFAGPVAALGVIQVAITALVLVIGRYALGVNTNVRSSS